MLSLYFPKCEFYDEKTQRFYRTKETTIQIEHSLVSISKWESKWHKSFVSSKNLTAEELIDYIRCMTVTRNVDDLIYKNLTSKHLEQVLAYIDDPMTATTFSDEHIPPSRETITSELIYWAMIEYKIPVEFEKWHINRLLTLLKICRIKNTPPKKMSFSEMASKRRAMNAARKAKLHTRG